MADYESRRSAMVERQLRGRGIEDERVLAAIGRVPRELFVPPGIRERAYADSALPIAAGQTISQPWVVAAICQALALRGEERVLEVGTGSGYSTCVLSLLAAEVVSVERHRQLAEEAREAIGRFGAPGVEVLLGDGSAGVPDGAPFDAIAVHAAAPAAPAALLEQLKEGGRLVIPISTGPADDLTLIHREGARLRAEVIAPCRFVPLVGEGGFEE
jgi:protein-L-isoaspartate(D-aspartate) O-methyltransferase